MSIIYSYEIVKDSLLKAYELILKCPLFEDKESIQEQKALLANEKFIISVCGGIKAGKSTLLNYLLFGGEEILPKDATPETDKLTKIITGPSKKAIVHFLTKTEWEEYKKSPGAESNKILASTLANISISKYIKDTQYSMELDNLAGLSKYISAKSDYSPLVRSVDVHINDRALDNIIVVDTPGLNDPCEARSVVTKNWVDKTDALIYVFNASQAFTKQDLDFLDNYCSHLDPGKIILVLSKIDLLKEIEGVQSYIYKMQRKDEFSNRTYLNEQKPYPISVISAMLKNCPNYLKDDEQDHYQRKISLDLIDKEGHMPALEEAINERLMKSKGQDILDSHNNKIMSALEKTLDNINHNIKLKQDLIEDYGKDKEELEAKKNEVQQLARMLEDVRKKLYTDIENIEIGLDNVITDLMEEGFKIAFNQYKTECDRNWIKFDTCITNTSIHFRRALKASVKKVLYIDSMEEFKDKVNDLFNNVYLEIRQSFHDASLDYGSIDKPVFDLSVIYKGIDDSINEALNSKEFSDLRKKVLLVFTNNKDSIAKLLEAVNELCTDLFNHTGENIKSELRRVYEKAIDRSFNTLIKYTDGLSNNVKQITFEHEDKKKVIQSIQGEINEEQENKRHIVSLKNEIDGKIAIAYGGKNDRK